MTTPTRSLASEEVYGEKWDRCMTDTIVKAGEFHFFLYVWVLILPVIASGLALGIVFSAVLFKRT